MISLKQLLILMGSVSLLMMIAVAVVKIQNPSYVTLGEVRAIDRICHRYADDMMARISSNPISSHTPQADQSLLQQLHECMGECRDYLIYSRSKIQQGTTSGQLTSRQVPACFGEKLSKLAHDAQHQAQITQDSKSSSPELSKPKE